MKHIRHIHFYIDELSWGTVKRTCKFSIVIERNEETSKPRFMSVAQLIFANALQKTHKYLLKKNQIDLGEDSDKTCFWLSGEFRSDAEEGEMVEGLLDASNWVVNSNLTFNEKVKECEPFYLEYKEQYKELFNEIADTIKNKKHQFNRQFIDGWGN